MVMLSSSIVPREMMMRPLAEMLWNAFRGVFFTKPGQTARGGGERDRVRAISCDVIGITFEKVK
jgi:hypothetical protein